MGQLTLEPIPRSWWRAGCTSWRTCARATEIVEAARATLLEQIDVLAREHDIKVNVKDFDIRPIRRFPEAGLELADKVAANLELSAGGSRPWPATTPSR